MSLSVKEFYGALLSRFVPRKCWLVCLLRNIRSLVNGIAYCSLNAIMAKLKNVPFWSLYCDWDQKICSICGLYYDWAQKYKFHLGVYTVTELKNISSIWGLYCDWAQKYKLHLGFILWLSSKNMFHLRFILWLGSKIKVQFGVYTMIGLKNISSIWGLYCDWAQKYKFHLGFILWLSSKI